MGWRGWGMISGVKLSLLILFSWWVVVVVVVATTRV